MGYKPMCDGGCCFIDATSCPAVRAALLVIHHVFGFGSVRPGQLEVMGMMFLSGAWKSICMFSVPLAYLSSAIAVSFSPYR